MKTIDTSTTDDGTAEAEGLAQVREAERKGAAGAAEANARGRGVAAEIRGWWRDTAWTPVEPRESATRDAKEKRCDTTT